MSGGRKIKIFFRGSYKNLPPSFGGVGFRGFQKMDGKLTWWKNLRYNRSREKNRRGSWWR